MQYDKGNIAEGILPRLDKWGFSKANFTSNINIPKKCIRQQNEDSDTDSTQAFKFINNTSLKNISSDKDLYQDVNKILLKENQDESTW